MERKRLKKVPRSAWLVVGVCIAAIVMPTAAVASVLTFTGIKGTSGNKADVSTAGQVLTAPATPSNCYATIRRAEGGSVPSRWTLTERGLGSSAHGFPRGWPEALVR